MADPHKPATPPVKDVPGQKHQPSSNIKDTGDRPAQGSPPAKGGSSEHRDPVLGTVDPLRRETETLPVEAHPGPKQGEPVGHARHAETKEEVEKISAMEGFGSEKSDRKVPPPGSRHFVAGQPVDDEEWEKTENEANRLADAGREQRTEAEQRMKENTPGDPDYHPADPDKRDTPQAQGQDRDKRAPSDRPGETNPKPHDRDYDKDKDKNKR